MLGTDNEYVQFFQIIIQQTIKGSRGIVSAEGTRCGTVVLGLSRSIRSWGERSRLWSRQGVAVFGAKGMFTVQRCDRWAEVSVGLPRHHGVEDGVLGRVDGGLGAAK